MTIAEQSDGESLKASINIPRHVFNRMVDWYNKPQKVRPIATCRGKK